MTPSPGSSNGANPSPRATVKSGPALGAKDGTTPSPGTQEDGMTPSPGSSNGANPSLRATVKSGPVVGARDGTVHSETDESTERATNDSGPPFDEVRGDQHLSPPNILGSNKGTLKSELTTSAGSTRQPHRKIGQTVWSQRQPRAKNGESFPKQTEIGGGYTFPGYSSRLGDMTRSTIDRTTKVQGDHLTREASRCLKQTSTSTRTLPVKRSANMHRCAAGLMSKMNQTSARSQRPDMYATNPTVSRSTSSCTSKTSEGAADSRAVRSMGCLTSNQLTRERSSHQPLVDSREPEPDGIATRRIYNPTTSEGAVFSKVCDCQAPRVQADERGSSNRSDHQPSAKLKMEKRPYSSRNPQSIPRFTHAEETVSTHDHRRNVDCHATEEPNGHLQIEKATNFAESSASSRDPTERTRHTISPQRREGARGSVSEGEEQLEMADEIVNEAEPDAFSGLAEPGRPRPPPCQHETRGRKRRGVSLPKDLRFTSTSSDTIEQYEAQMGTDHQLPPEQVPNRNIHHQN